MTTEHNDIPDIFKNVAPRENSEADELQQRAQAVIHSLAESYLDNVHTQIHDLKRGIQEARALSGEERVATVKNQIFKPAHDMKGQGTTFGYPVLTALGAHICALIRSGKMCDESMLNAFEADVADMETVIKFPAYSDNEILAGIRKRLEENA